MSQEKNNYPWYRYYFQGASKSLKYPEVPIYWFLEENAQKHPNKTALSFYKNSITYSKLNELTNKFAATLNTLGITRGDRVAFLLPNCPQFVIGVLGTMKTGAIPVVLNPLYSKEELSSCLGNARPRVLVSLEMFSEKIVGYQGMIILTKISDYFSFQFKILFDIKKFFSSLRIFSRKKNKNSLPLRQKVFWFRKLLKNSALSYRKESSGDIDIKNDVALIIYTSGTTGAPKGVMLTHYNIVSNAFAINEWAKTIEANSFLAVLPLFHIYGLTLGLFVAILRTAKVVLLPRFHTKEVANTIQKEKIQYFVGVPQMYAALYNLYRHHSQRYTFESLTVCSSGAAPMSSYLWRNIKAMAPRAKIIEGYGLTETSPVVLVDPVVEDYQKREGSPGVPIYNTDVRIVDIETGEELATGEPGEIVVKGPQVFKGYWQNPDATRRSLKGGWLFTHDIGHMTPDGRFFIHERVDDIINVKGEMVWPGRVENVLKRHPNIKEAGVIGIRSEYHNQAVKAYIVLEEGKTLTKQDIIDFCKDKLAPYEIPVFVEFVKKLPRTYVGKLQRYKLRQRNMLTNREKITEKAGK